LAIPDDNIITEHDGYISEVRIQDDKPPITVGEFGISIWNIELGQKLNINLNELVENHHLECTYDELLKIMSKKEIDINTFSKIVFITNLVLRPDYRKLGITEEFVEYIYRDFYTKSNAVIALVKPLQDNPIDIDFFLNHNYVEVRTVVKDFHNYENVSAKIYYSIEDLSKKTDKEINEYKLFALANKCGFKRIDDSHLFILTPDKMFQRVLEKREFEKKSVVLKP
jgi:hypothetical protein